LAPLAMCALFFVQTGCQKSEQVELAQSEQAVIGSLQPDVTVFNDTCSMHVILPPNDQGMPQAPIRCTCTVVGNRFVLTAARCVDQNVQAGTISNISVRFGPDESANPIPVLSVQLHRYYDPANIGASDLALVRLSADPNPAARVAVVRSQSLGLDSVGTSVTLVGYGIADNNVVGERFYVAVQLSALEGGFLRAGTTTATTCEGDSGGPVFAYFGGPTEELVGVTLMHAAGSGCSSTVPRARIAPNADRFVHAYVDRFEGPCPLDGVCTTVGCRSPDPDCDPCLWNGICKEDCPTRDWDCPLGSFVGDACVKSGDCEEGGRCVAAVDDASFTYCTRPCDPSLAGECPRGMGCTALDSGGGECVWLTPSPGSQGFSCSTGTDCRSGICEGRICVNVCDLSQGASACPSGYRCDASRVAPGTTVCLGAGAGGGGFCATDGHGGGGTALAIGLAIALTALVARRRRRR
jgi:V8-like Glu-specific endopeptidase